MASRFMTDPHAMRDMAGRFEVHAQTVEDEARRMWASAQNISGAGWSGMAEATSLDTMAQMNQAFRNIVNMLHGVRRRRRKRRQRRLGRRVRRWRGRWYRRSG